MRILLWLAVVVVFAGQAAGGEAAFVKRTEAGIAIGNKFLELRFKAVGGRCTAMQLVNKLANRTLPIRSDDLSLGVEGRRPLVSADLAFKKADDEAIPGGRRLTLRFENKSHGVRLDVVYELADRDFFLRRRLEASVTRPLALRRVDVWRVGVQGTCAHQGFGEPVFLDDTFWGLEYPGGENRFADGTVTLSQYPGRTVADRFVSKTAVLGVAEPHRVARRFRRYVETFRVTPKRTALFVNYNTWWTLMPPTEKNCLALIDLFRRNLFEPHGESFDTFTIDDGWDDKKSLWKIRADRFPKGFAPLVGPLKAMKANLGLWLSPSSGYGHAPWGGANGYEHNSNKWYLCQSGPKYRRDIVKVVTNLAKEYDMAFFKFDGFCPTCEATGHGHLPGPYAREANIDAYLELLTAVRRARPGVYLDPTCGMWLSPWWLRYVDSIWGSVSGDYPAIVVPAPVVRDSATSTRDAVFRQRCREHPGYPPAAVEHLGIIVITGEKWEDNAMAVAGRGCRLLTLYIDPKHFRNGERDWAFLASVLKWVRHNAETLQHTEMVPGDPFQREPYGYAHFAGARGILSLRNPFIEPKAVRVRLDESVGWQRAEAGGTFAARIVYPREETLAGALRHGDVLEVQLQAYETVTVHVERAGPERVPLAGVRAHEAHREGRRVVYTVYGRPGGKMTARAAAPITGASLDGQALPLDPKKPLDVPIVFPGDERPCRVEDARLVLKTPEGPWSLDGNCVAIVPPGTAASLHLLCDPRGGPADALECSARVGGKPARVRVVRSGGHEEHSRHAWTWLEFALPAGRNDVSVTVKPAKQGAAFRGRVGWWLWAEHPLTKGTLTLEFAKAPPPSPPEPLPVPLRMAHERQIVTIQAPKAFRVARRWPKLGPAGVYLDRVAPDETSQGWGKLQRNQSVWEKPMVVAGRTFDRGLGTHANSHIVYDLAGGKFRTFRCLVGRDAHGQDGRIVFQVKVDGKKVFDSGPMTKATAAKAVEANLAGAAELELICLDGGDGISGDHGNWADAQLLHQSPAGREPQK